MLLPSHLQAIRPKLDHLLKISKACNLKGDELEERIKEEKLREAQMIIQGGFQKQAEYIFETYGSNPELIEKAFEEIRDILKDYAPAGIMCRCTTCRRDEFRMFATRHGEGWICPRCVEKMNKES